MTGGEMRGKSSVRKNCKDSGTSRQGVGALEKSLNCFLLVVVVVVVVVYTHII